MKIPKLITITALCLTTSTCALFAADPSPHPSDSGKMMNMQSMMKDKDMMRQMCAEMSKDPAIVKMTWIASVQFRRDSFDIYSE